MNPDYKWIAQDADGAIWGFQLEPAANVIHNGFYTSVGDNEFVEKGNPNPGWRDSLIDLEKEDYEIVDGILIRKPKAKKQLTDTELLDAIVEHKLIVDWMDDGRSLIWKAGGGGVDTYNKKGDIRKAIKKWLRKNT